MGLHIAMFKTFIKKKGSCVYYASLLKTFNTSLLISLHS